ncbi:MAG: hypothetical protein ACREQH_11595 [Candidatus Binatus sp.]
MKAILSMAIVAICSTALAGCWLYSRPDTSTGCQKTTYGLAVATTSTEDCPPAPEAGATPSSAVPHIPPPLPSPGMM